MTFCETTKGFGDKTVEFLFLTHKRLGNVGGQCFTAKCIVLFITFICLLGWSGDISSEARRNANSARHLYGRFPERKLPIQHICVAISQRLLDTGDVVVQLQNRGPQRLDAVLAAQENVLNAITGGVQRKQRRKPEFKQYI